MKATYFESTHVPASTFLGLKDQSTGLSRGKFPARKLLLDFENFREKFVH